MLQNIGFKWLVWSVLDDISLKLQVFIRQPYHNIVQKLFFCLIITAATENHLGCAGFYIHRHPILTNFPKRISEK